MPGVAGRARALALVGVHTPYPCIRPRIGVELACFNRYRGAMALFTAGVCCRPTADYLAEHVIQRADEARRVGMAARQELRRFVGMAGLTVFRRDQDDYLVTIVIDDVRSITLPCRTMASPAIGSFCRVFARRPVLDHSGRRRFVAVQT